MGWKILRRCSGATLPGALIVLLALAACHTPAKNQSSEGPGLKTPRIAVDFPEKYNTVDGMVLDGEGNIIVSCPNFNNDGYVAKILRIDQEDRVSEVATLPVHPSTKKVGPLGVEVDPDGHIYVADNQSGFSERPASRLLRVSMKNGKAQGCEVLVSGFVQSNAVSYHDGYIYVTETKLDPDATPLVSGVYRFALSELNTDSPIRLKPGGKDEHLLLTIETHNTEWRVGANGMGFDKDGNLYFCNFGDAQIVKVTFDGSGNVASQEIFAEGQGMKSTDGIKFHPKTGDLYVADFVGNAVHKVDGKTGEVTTLARNGNTDGKNGELDRPSEVCIRGNRLYIANIDLPYGGNVYDKPHTISVIELDE